MQGVLYPGGEDQHRMPVQRVLGDLAAGRAHQPVIVHQILDLARHELAAPEVQPRRVGLAPPRLGLERTQVALRHQFAHTDSVADMVEQIVRPADQPRAHAVGCGRQAHQPHMRVHRAGLRQKRAVHAFPVGRQHVRLVNEDQVEAVQFGRPAVYALDARDDNRVFRVTAPHARRIDTDPVPQIRGHRVQLLDRLFEQFLDVSQDQHAPVPLLDRVAADRRHHRRLAARRRDHHAKVVVPLAQVIVDSGDSLFLVGSQFHV